MKKHNINFYSVSIILLFILIYFQFYFYHDDIVLLYDHGFMKKKIDDINIKIIFQDRYLHDILMRLPFYFFKDQIEIYTIIKMLNIIILSILILILSTYIFDLDFKKNISTSLLFLLSPFILGTTYWQTNIAWLFLANFYFLSLIFFLNRVENKYIFFYFLIINHIICLNLQMFIFNAIIILFLFKKNISKIKKYKLKKYYFILILIQTIITIYFVLTSSEKTTVINDYNFLELIKNSIKHLIINIGFLFYDSFKIFNLLLLPLIYSIYKIIIIEKKNYELYIALLIIFCINLLIFTFAKYDFRVFDVESRVFFLVSIYIQLFILITFKDLELNKYKIIFLFCYLFGFLNHANHFIKIKTKQNEVTNYILRNDLYKNNIIEIDPSGTTFFDDYKLKYYLIIKTNNLAWSNKNFRLIPRKTTLLGRVKENFLNLF